MSSNSESLVGAVTELLAYPLFHDLKHDEVQSLCDGGQIRVLSHREVLFRHGEPANFFGVVVGGAFKLSRLAQNGDDTVIHFCSPGDVLAALVMPQPRALYPLTAHAMGPSRAIMIRREVYLQKWLANPGLIARMQSLLSMRMSRLQGQKVMQRAPLSAKVAALLLQLVCKDKSGEEMSVPLPLTRKEIADSLGVTVESVIRVMSDWGKKGLVVTSDQSIRILQPDRLIQQVDGEEG